MKLNRPAFTLIEMMISITILSIMMLFLYKSYANLNISNSNLKQETSRLLKRQEIKKVIYLDFLTALYHSTIITNREKNEDFVVLQSTHSLHRRFNPYISYMVKNKKLYRLESLKKFTEYELASDSEFDIDYIGEVNSFRLYQSKENEMFLVHIDFKNRDEILLKINPLNEY
ncbi:MAG: prepilin-type N-terminal cleavage/methylation domain-containing protein [Sulfurimonas sp.]